MTRGHPPATTVIYIGTAGWSLPKAVGQRFAGPGSHLERYARVLQCTELNSTFKRVHRRATYARWAESTPLDFRFAVKMPGAITHEQRLVNVDGALAEFLGDVELLGLRLGPVLVQLPASLEFDERIAGAFFATLRRRYANDVVCEPRHPGWFSPNADQLMRRFRIARVAADPAPVVAGEQPGGWRGDSVGNGLVYFRWHGAPRIYRSSYEKKRLENLAERMRTADKAGDCWCVLDNTAEGAAAQNALDLLQFMHARASGNP
jgi:uncharacterized protein YecE (DUF72 family)